MFAPEPDSLGTARPPGGHPPPPGGWSRQILGTGSPWSRRRPTELPCLAARKLLEHSPVFSKIPARPQTTTPAAGRTSFRRHARACCSQDPFTTTHRPRRQPCVTGPPGYGTVQRAALAHIRW
jgi:hypothetical protein